MEVDTSLKETSKGFSMANFLLLTLVKALQGVQNPLNPDLVPWDKVAEAFKVVELTLARSA